MESILQSIKKMLGIEPEYTHFDPDIIAAINSVIMVLTQVGVGPSQGFYITDERAEWMDFLGTRIDLEAVKTYIYLRVKLIFDPPTTSFVLNAMQEQIREFEWRLNINADPPVVIEGGADDE